MNSETDDTTQARTFGLGDLTYGLYGCAMLLGALDKGLFLLLATSALIIAYLKRESASDTLLESHFAWQIGTFWLTLIGLGAGVALVALGVGGITAALLGSGLQGSIPIIGAGWLLILATSLWYVYRITKGWLWLRERERL
jgi:uncharacterized membrane protein